MVGKACSAVLLLVLGFVWVEVRGKRDVRAAAQLGLPAEVQRSLSCLPAQDRARTLIANHIAHLDILVMMALDLPAFVAKAATQDVPLVGYIASALGCIFVKGATSQGQAAEEEQKTPPTSRAQASPSDFTWDWFSAVWRIARAADDALLPKQQREAAPRSAVSEIIARQERLARDAEHLRAGGSGSVDALPKQGWLGAMHASVWPWLAAHGWVGLDDVSPPLLVFAEGTTTNGSDVMQFRRGAFFTSSTVQPIAITYHWRHASESWESVPVGVHAFRLLTQLTHAVTISYLPIVAPEQEPPAVPPFDL
ncbi:LPEAT2, partial [Symbiodinium sp. KB8]